MDFDRLIDRRGTNSDKWEEYGDALPLWVADTDFAAPEPVLQALRQCIQHGVFGYTSPPAELREVVQAWLQQRHGWRVDLGAISFAPGVMNSVHMVGRGVGRPGDGVLVQPPVYSPFFDVPKFAGRELQTAEIPQVNSGRYEIDFDTFEAAITGRTRLFILCNPHNPVGRVWSRAELECLADVCLRHDVIICSDEIHSDLVFQGHGHIPVASLSPEVAARTVTVFAPSKTFNMPGLGFSVMVIEEPELRRQVKAAGAGLIYRCNLMGYAAGLAAYRDCADWLELLLAYLQANRDFVDDFVHQRLPGVTMVRPEATYLAWLDCRGSAIRGNPHRFFLENAGVALNDGATFGPGGERFVRLNFGCPRATLVEALERMENALEEIQS